jgi:hypothetical protein
MSARDLILPQRALDQVLRELQRQVRQAEQVVSWPGAVRFVELTSPVPLPTPTVVDVLTLPLDPGGWMLFGGMNVHTTHTGGASSSYGLRVGATAPDNPWRRLSTQWVRDLLGPSVDPLGISNPVRLSAIGNATLTAQSLSPVGRTSVVQTAFLIAVAT